METKFDAKKYIATEYGAIVGAKIIGVRPLTDEETEMMGWDDGYSSGVPFLIILDNGRALVPSIDAEGNGAGHVFVEQMTS